MRRTARKRLQVALLAATVGCLGCDGPYLFWGECEWVVTTPSELSLALLVGDGTGTLSLARQRTFTPCPEFLFMTSGDLDGDGAAEVIGVTQAGQGTVLRGADLAPVATFSLGLLPSVAALGDLDGDGRADLICSGPEGLATALGLPAGGFAAARVVDPTARWADRLEVANLVPGAPVELVLQGQDDRGQFVVYHGDGAGDLTEAQRVLRAPYPGSGGGWAVGDLDDDGLADLVYWSFDLNAVRRHVALNDGAGSFLPPVDTLSGGSGPLVFVGRFDADSFADVLSTDGQFFKLYRGDGAGGLSSAGVQYLAGDAFGDPVGRPTDLDADGDLDLVGVSWLDPGSLRILRNGGDGDFSAEMVLSGRPESSFEPWLIDDVDGDGALDGVYGVGVAEVGYWREQTEWYEGPPVGGCD